MVILIWRLRTEMEKTAERKRNLSVGNAAKAIRTDALKRIFKIIFKD